MALESRVFCYVRRLAVITTVTLPFCLSPATADVGSLIRKLDQTEWEIVRNEVVKRLPSLIATREEQAALKKTLASAQKIAALAEALQANDYVTVQRISTEYLADNLEGAIAARYGKDSRLYRSVKVVGQNRVLARELMRAALNANPDAATHAIRSALVSHARARIGKLRSQGEKFWKDMLLKVVPGGSRLASYGFNPVDIYIQSIRDFRDFTSATRKRFNDAVLNCQAKLYLKVVAEAGDHESAVERLEIYGSNLGGTRFKCRQTSGPGTTLQRWVDSITSLGSGAAGLGELGLTIREVATLARLYGQESERTRRNVTFSDWLHKRLVTRIKDRARVLRDTIAAEQQTVARRLASELRDVISAIRREIAGLKRDDEAGDGSRQASTDRTGESGNDTPPGQDGDPGDAREDGDEDGEREVTEQCDRLIALVASAGRRSAADPSQLAADLQTAEAAARGEANCRADVFASAARARERLQQMASLRERLQSAISSCDVDSLKSLSSRASRIAPGIFDNRITMLQTAKTAIDAFERGRTAYGEGRIATARQQLKQAIGAFRELPDSSCQTYVNRAQRELGNVARIEAGQARVNRAVASCNVDEMEHIATSFKSRKHVFFRASRRRIAAKMSECREKDRIIAEGKFCDGARSRLDRARSDYKATRLKAARRQLVALERKLTEDNTKRCSSLPARVRRGLDRITALELEMVRLDKAVKKCRIRVLEGRLARYRRKTHAWFRTAEARAKRAIGSCRKKRPGKAGAIADCRRQAARAGKVYAAVRRGTDGTYSCHTCERGNRFVDGRCWSLAALAERDCRKQAAQRGKVYAKTVMRSNGGSVCHWCEPGNRYVNGQCWSVAAIAEADCRRQAAARSKVYARTIMRNDGSSVCQWCEPGHTMVNGQCWTNAAVAEANCRRDIARRRKVYGTTVVYRNGQYRCFWCQPGYYFRNGRCYSRAGDVARAAAAINNLIRSQRRRRDGRSTPGRTMSGQIRRRQPGQPGRQPPARCVVNGFVNHTDPRCRKYWR